MKFLFHEILLCILPDVQIFYFPYFVTRYFRRRHCHDYSVLACRTIYCGPCGI